MQYSELLLIVRGYRRRGVLHYQLLREILFCTLFTFRENKYNKTSEDIWPLYFDRYKTAKPEVQLSDEEVNDLLDDMAAFTEYLQKEAKK